MEILYYSRNPAEIQSYLPPSLLGGIKGLSRNNFLPDDVRAGEAEQGIIGAEGFLEADEDLSEAVDPAMTGFHNPTTGNIVRIVFFVPAHKG